jgi:phospholipid/cholesterol/gamma-HCH transport system ATP-binding protein
MSKIIIKDICKNFGSKQVLTGINLEVKKGESLVVIGGSGSGKSVLLKTVLGLIQPDTGEIILDGQNIAYLQGSKRQASMAKFGMLFQGGALFDSLTVWQNISFVHIENMNMKPKDAKDFAISLLNKVGLNAAVADMMPAELSGGMQKRVGLARAIAMSPEIILFDEPTTGLDPITTDVINNLIVKCSQSLGATTITITHDMASVRKVADKVAMIHSGKIIWFGNKEEMDTTDNPYIRQFVAGSSDGPITMELEAH